MPVTAAQAPGAKLATGRGQIPHSMNKPDPTAPALDVGPVRQTAQRGRNRDDETDPDQVRGRRAARPPAQRVEHSCAYPRTDHQIGQQRMKRVPQPTPGERILDAAPVPDRLADSGLEALRRPVESLDSAQLIDESVNLRHHEAMALGCLACEPIYPSD
jgi:hypothetical protein